MTRSSNHPYCPNCHRRAENLRHPTRKKTEDEVADDVADEVEDQDKDQDKDIRSWDRHREYQCTCGYRFVTKEIYFESPHVWVHRRRNENPIEEFCILKLGKSIGHALGPDASVKLSMSFAQDIFRKLQMMPKGDVPGAGRIFSAQRVGEEVLSLLLQEGEHAGWLRYSLLFRSKEYRNWQNLTDIVSLIADTLTLQSEALSRIADAGD